MAAGALHVGLCGDRNKHFHSAGLQSAFATVNKVVNIATGTLPGAVLPSGATLPVSEIDTLANVLAACINSPGGAAGDQTSCGKLFTAATPAGGAAPTDTLSAAIDIARNPSSSVSALFDLASPTAPFQPSLASAPNNFLIGINYVGGGLSSPQAIALDASGNVWLANSGNSSLTELSSTGTALSPAAGYTGGGLNAPSTLAIDLSGNIWAANLAGAKSGTAVRMFGFIAGTKQAPTEKASTARLSRND